MSVIRSGGCQEVCAEIRKRLETLDVLKPQDVRHGPLFEALEKCTLVTNEDLEILLTSTLAWVGECAPAMTDAVVKKYRK